MVKVVCTKEELMEAMDDARVALNWLVKVIERTLPEDGTGQASGLLYTLQVKSANTANSINQMLFCLKGD